MENKRQTIAYCITTYKRPETVNIVFENNVELYKEYGIDVYVYDSSPDNETEKVIKKYVDQGYDNICFIKISSEIPVIEKIKMIYDGYGLKKKYDYFWLMKDRVYWSRNLFSRIEETIEECPDVIMLRAIECSNSIRFTKDTYDNPVEFFADWAWLMTSWDVTIYRYDKFNEVIDWNYLSTKYFIDDDTNFPQNIVVFDTMAQWKDCDAKVLMARTGEDNFNAPYSEDNRKESILKVWGYNWYYTNMKLPSVYDDVKPVAIKMATTLPWIIGEELRLIDLWLSGGLTDEKIACVEDIWSEINDVPWDTVCKISDGDRDFVESLFLEKMWILIERGMMVDALYYANTCISIFTGTDSKDIKYLRHALEIYSIENAKGQDSLFRGGRSRDFITTKIDIVITLLRTLEKNEGIRDEQMKNFILGGMVSMSMIGYLLVNENMNEELIADRLRYLLS